MADHHQSSDDEINHMEKHGVTHHEVVTDKEIVGNKSKENAAHYGELTAEERKNEKILRRKIDSVIMPCVILVYLMNFVCMTTTNTVT